jgi:hypothetical protein
MVKVQLKNDEQLINYLLLKDISYDHSDGFSGKFHVELYQRRMKSLYDITVDLEEESFFYVETSMIPLTSTMHFNETADAYKFNDRIVDTCFTKSLIIDVSIIRNTVNERDEYIFNEISNFIEKRKNHELKIIDVDTLWNKNDVLDLKNMVKNSSNRLKELSDKGII